MQRETLSCKSPSLSFPQSLGSLETDADYSPIAEQEQHQGRPVRTVDAHGDCFRLSVVGEENQASNPSMLAHRKPRHIPLFHRVATCRVVEPIHYLTITGRMNCRISVGGCKKYLL